MTYAKKTLSEIKLIHGNYGNFIKGQKLDKKKEKKYKTPPYQDCLLYTSPSPRDSNLSRMPSSA